MDQSEFFTFIPLWLWILVAALALAARFSFLTGLFVWPNFDESAYGFEALQLADQGGPHFFYGVSQAPPFFIWGLALFFKLFGVSMELFEFFRPSFPFQWFPWPIWPLEFFSRNLFLFFAPLWLP